MSSIVVTDGKKFWGLSLKKKESRDSTDPTLINKPITGKKSFLSALIADGAMSQQELDNIENKKNEFFTNIIASYWIASENKRTTYKHLKTMRRAVAAAAKLNDVIAITNTPVRKNTNRIQTGFTLDSNDNAVVGGPITIDSGVSVVINGSLSIV